MNTSGIPLSSSLKPHQASLVIAGLVSLLLWVVPFLGFVLLPLQYLNTHLHEFCHAFMAILSGGEVRYIHVFKGGDGVTLASGSPFLVNPAGYIGAVVIGALLIWFGRTERGAAIMMRGLAIVMVFSFIFWIRGDVVGVISGIFWLLALLALPSMLKGRHLVFAAQFLGMQQCLTSVQALYILFHISAFSGGHSDAQNMAQFTGIPALFWAVLWGVLGLGTFLITLRASWTNRLPNQ
jgi:uncharacterized membrane protein